MRDLSINEIKTYIEIESLKELGFTPYVRIRKAPSYELGHYVDVIKEKDGEFFSYSENIAKEYQLNPIETHDFYGRPVYGIITGFEERYLKEKAKSIVNSLSKLLTVDK